jgi:hypothetical protein
MDANKREALLRELPSLQILYGETFLSTGEKLMRLAQIQIEMIEAGLKGNTDAR